MLETQEMIAIRPGLTSFGGDAVLSLFHNAQHMFTAFCNLLSVTDYLRNSTLSFLPTKQNKEDRGCWLLEENGLCI